MLTKQILLTFCVCIILVNIGFSQGFYLDRGQSGFGINAGFSTNKDVSGFGGSAGYSISGIFDLRFFIGRFSLDEKLSGYDVSVVALQPGVTFHVIKQDTAGMPVSIALSAGYERDSYSSTALDQNGWTLTGNYFSFGATIYGNVDVSPTTYIQPSGGVFYITGSNKLEDSFGNSQTTDNNTTVFGLASGFVFKIKPTSRFVIEPAVSFNEDNTTFSITAGFVFATLR